MATAIGVTQGLGASSDVERRQKGTLADGAMYRTPGFRRDSAKGREIDMGGQIRLARIGQDIGEFMAAYSLQRFAGTACGMAIVDH